MNTTMSHQIGKVHGSAVRRSRLDEILARHQRRRVRTVKVLVLWTVVCGALLAM
jgi:hypothetical protein